MWGISWLAEEQLDSHKGVRHFVHHDLLKIQFPCICAHLERSIIAFIPTHFIMEDYSATRELWIWLHFLTIWITSSSCMTWCTPTRCGEYLVLVPCTKKENMKITVKYLYFQNTHWEILLLNDTSEKDSNFNYLMFLCSNWQHWLSWHTVAHNAKLHQFCVKLPFWDSFFVKNQEKGNLCRIYRQIAVGT